MTIKVFSKIALSSALLIAFPALADWPVGVADSASTHQSLIDKRIDVLANDIGDNLKITAANSWSEKGGRITFTEDYLMYTGVSVVGEDAFWYVLTDDQGRTNAAKVTMTVKARASRYPDPQNDAVKVSKDTSIRIDVIKNDIGNIPQITTFSEASEQGGTIVKVDVNSSFPQLEYTPPQGFVGTDTFSYTVTNAGSPAVNQNNSAQVTVEVSEENSSGDYPQTSPESLVVNSNCFGGYCQSVYIPVLRNDSGKNLKLILNSPWSLKGADLRPLPFSTSIDPVLVYQPKVGMQGEDKVWYVIEDEIGRKNWGVVTIDLTTQEPLGPTLD